MSFYLMQDGVMDKHDERRGAETPQMWIHRTYLVFAGPP